MVSKGSHGYVLSLTLLFVLSSSIPHVANGSITVAFSAITASGNLVCTPTGNPSPIGISLPLVGATVVVSCPNISATAVTNANGYFNVTLLPPINVNLNLNLTTSSLLPNCTATVRLPVRGCLALPRIGFIRAVLTPVGLLVGVTNAAGGLLNGVLVARVFGFTLGI